MAKYNKPSKANKSVGMIIVTLIFIIIGIVCIATYFGYCFFELVKDLENLYSDDTDLEELI